ncbi:MAG: nucleoside deaminase [Ruminococcaceae bacterium]|nr:nucleoside deaminase [Oscillospiraceae bacterium]
MENEYMKKAIALAMESEKEGEVPVGAVIVKDGKIIATGRNRRETEKNALCHAEIEAINNACKKLGGWRLFGCDLYVTLEPCPMCAGAIINSRIKTVYFGAYDNKAGSFGSVADFNRIPYNHKPEIIEGVMEEECSKLLSDFFKKLRDKK